MSEEELIVAVVAIVSGTGFTIFLFHSLFSFAKYLISNRRGQKADGTVVSKAEFEELKGRLERRIQTLEAIVIDEQPARLVGHETEPNDYASPTSGLKNKLKTR